MSVQYNPKIITDSLVLCLDAANPKSYGGSGTTWTDLSGRGNTGTLVNGVGYNASNGGSLSFDGVDDYVTTGFTYANNSDFTMSCWMKTSTTQKSGLMGIRPSGNLTSGWYQLQVYVTGDADAGIVGNNICFSNFTSTPGNFLNKSVFVSGINVTNGNWKNIIAISNLTESKVYIDGVLVGTATTTTTLNRGSANFIVGGAGNYPSGLLSGYYYTGQVSNTSFYNRELSAAEVKQNYNATKSRYGL